MTQDEIEAIAQRPTYCKADGEAVTLSRAERDALVAMARRYAWLREQHWSSASLFVVDGRKSQIKLGTHCPSGNRLNDAIDAAMVKESP